MKKVLISLLFVCSVFSNAQDLDVMVIERVDNSVVRINVSDIKQIVFESTDANPNNSYQKDYLEKVALEFMDMMPESDFDDIAELGNYINQTYCEDYDWTTVTDWADDVLDAAREALGTKTTETETWGNSIQNYIYTNYKSLLMASNFTGHFTAQGGGWSYSNATDLQFIFPDKQGSQCIVKLETSGKIQKVHAFDYDDWFDYDYYSSGGKYYYNDYYDRTQYTLGVPENIVVTLTQNGKQVVKNTFKIDLTNMSNEEFDLSKNGFNISSLVELNNGYKINISKVAYTPNSNASFSYLMSKNGTPMLTMTLSANVMDLPSVNLSAFTVNGYDSEEYDFDSSNAKNAFVKLDVLGKIQIQGSLSDVRKFVDYLDLASENDNRENTYKSYVNQANSLINLNLFYDNSSIKQATVFLEPFAEETWNGVTYWTCEPVIQYNDGSSYSTFEAFFNEVDFKKTIDTFKSLADKYADLIDERIYW